ncbi:hypothetical protein RN001_012387 [Aquatica leii]|uniref:Cytochrome P450 n=1 Tax=Aquatica leii TaxID=1421715 RepID=A0AAN7NYE9_9COLE|nr:hypothetical protein RN001_012387 [Aquatica leii]
MKEQFEASLKKLYVESNNRSTLLLEADYKLLLSEVKETQRLRNSGESLSSKQYRRLKRYDLLNIGQDEKLIAKRYTDNDNIRFYVYLDQLFDIINAAHINTGHKREKGMTFYLLLLTEFKIKIIFVSKENQDNQDGNVEGGVNLEETSQSTENVNDQDGNESELLVNNNVKDGWHSMRSTLSPAFTGSKMKVLFALMQECSNQFIQHLKKQNKTVSIDVKDVVTKFANDIIGTCAFGINCDSLENPQNEFYLMGKEATDISGFKLLKYFGYGISPILMKLLGVKIYNYKVSSFFRLIIKKTLDYRRNNKITRPDMIHLMIEAQKYQATLEDNEMKKQSVELSDESLTAQALVFFNAGFEAVSTQMSYVVYELAVNPHIQQKLFEEINETVTDKKITYDALSAMKYLDCVISESLRLRFSLPLIDRKCMKPITIDPVLPFEKPLHLEEGSIVWIPTCGLHYDEKYFPNPEKFDPERFNDENRNRIVSFTYMPFGCGPRNCIGNFASNIFRTKSFPDVIIDIYKKFSDHRYVGIYQFNEPVLLIRDLELIKQIMVKDFDFFPDHRTFLPPNVDSLWGKNIFQMSVKDGWHSMRTTLSPAFTGSKMKVLFSLMQECSNQFIHHFKKQNKTVSIDVKDVVTRFANDIIGTCAFGINCDSLENPENEFYLMGKEATDVSGFKILKFFGYGISPFLTKLFGVKIYNDKVSSFFRKIIKETLDYRKNNNIIRPDMIHLMMEAQKNQATLDDNKMKKQSVELSDESMTAQALIFFNAGFETVSTAMSYAIYELAVHSDIQQKLFEEISEAVTDKKITYDVLSAMKYLDCVVSESLRLHVPTPILDRKCRKSYTIDPVLPFEKPLHLEEGSSVWIPACALQNDEQYFPNPEKFDPERFNSENQDKIISFTYLPFGSGPRNCIGSRFGLLEIKLILVELLQHFEIIPNEKTQIPIKLSKANFNSIPDDGIWVSLKPRKYN